VEGKLMEPESVIARMPGILTERKKLKIGRKWSAKALAISCDFGIQLSPDLI
jgi:hypothetical protein